MKQDIYLHRHESYENIFALCIRKSTGWQHILSMSIDDIAVIFGASVYENAIDMKPGERLRLNIHGEIKWDNI